MNPSYPDAGVSAGVSLVVLLVEIIFSAGVYVWVALTLRRVFEALGEEGWKAWVPVLNTVTLFRLGGVNPLWILAFLVPFVNIVGVVMEVIAIGGINRRLGKGTGCTVLAFFLFPIWTTLLAVELGRSGAPATDANGLDTRLAGMGVSPQALPPMPAPAPGSAVPIPEDVAVPVAPLPPASTAMQPPPGFPGTAPASPSVTPAVPAQAAAAVPPAPPEPVAPAAEPALVPEPAPIAAAPVPEPVEGPDPWAPPISSIPGMVTPTIVAVVPPPPPAPAPIVPVPVPVPAPLPVTEDVAAPAIDLGSTLIFSAPEAPEAPSIPEAPEIPDTPSPVDPTGNEASHDTVIAGRRLAVWSLVPDGGSAVSIVRSTVLVGRSPVARTDYPSAQLVALDDPSKTLSKTHAVLALGPAGWTITDLGSTNGVLVWHTDGTSSEPDPAVATAISDRFTLGELDVRISKGS